MICSSVNLDRFIIRLLLKTDSTQIWRSFKGSSHLDKTQKIFPIPSQSGAFLINNDWAFNELSLSVSNHFNPGNSDILLLGDSVVYGGNHFKQSEKLGPQLDELLPGHVWPAATGGWQLLNELAFLKAHPQLMKLQTLVFITNSGDFGPATEWDGELKHPTKRPLIASWYLFRRYILARTSEVSFDLPPSSNSIRLIKKELHDVLGNYTGRIFFITYPTKLEMENGHSETSNFLNLVTTDLNQKITIASVGSDTRWRTTLYRDSIHPSIDGTRTLALALHDILLASK